MEKVEHLRIPLEKIREATNNFDQKHFIAKGGFGSVYKGELSWSNSSITVAVKRLDPTSDQGDQEFLMEITMLSSYRHKNLVSLVGFCDEDKEKVLVYMHESRGSLDIYIHDPNLTWKQRLKISIGAARGLNYLHDEVGPQHRVLHRDIKSANILLSDEWEAKVSDFGLSKIGPANLQHTFLVTNACGTFGYLDPIYYRSGVLTKESDVYSFGVVLLEILCGRLAAENGQMFLGPLAETQYEENKLDEIINPTLRKQMKLNSLNTFSAIAYQCIKNNRSERPTMARVIEKLENAFEIQVSLKTPIIARVGTWGTKSTGGPQNRWDFLMEKDHKLKMITVDHGDLIYSLMFTTESNGVLYTSNKAGGWNGGDIVSKVVFDDDEELIDINGTVGVSKGQYAGYTIISSLSFVTNKMIHGPFGEVTNAPFSVPCEKGSFGGFYGLAGYYIDSIGVYMRANSEEITRVGIWGTKSPGGPRNQWSFQLERNHYLKKITIDHGDLIYSLMFTTEYRGLEKTTDKAGGWNGGDIVSEVTLEWGEEINAISGTIGVSEGTYAGYTIISSLSFVTSKKTHGPYGRAKGTPFTVPWDKGSFAGFYGKQGYYIDGIGVYLKATM
ncbi:hypothetical protein OSB04_021387 [Centaurea solstitialis]|uniref:Jacalin-like lectin domain-containing protein n=1 Tax=Centaurea solstitialis TaxID=347529 RepID=A0AA38SVQ8_9ASTR|nr:hypothetical protein OSB04_021387 [Centaurea solstitialis]